MDLELIEKINNFEENTRSANPDIEISDRKIDIYIQEGLSSSRWNVEDTEDSKVTLIPANTTRKIAVHANRRVEIVPLVRKKALHFPKIPLKVHQGLQRRKPLPAAKITPS